MVGELNIECTLCDDPIEIDDPIRKWSDGSGYAHKKCIDNQKILIQGVPRGLTTMEQLDADRVRSKQPIKRKGMR